MQILLCSASGFDKMCRHKESKYGNIIFVILLLIGVFFIAGRLTSPVKLIKNLVYYISYPTLRTADCIFRSMGTFADNVKAIVYMHRENIVFKQKNQELNDKLRNYNSISEECNNLSRLLKLTKIKNIIYVFAGISFGASDERYQWCILDKGGADGLYNELPVAMLNKENDILCAAGKIIETHKTSSKVVLITDSISVIPVEIKDKGINCLAEGSNSSLLKITYIPSDADVKPGDEIVVSGLSAVFQKGMPVGVITEVSEGASADFKTAAAKVFYENNIFNKVVVLVPQKQ
ncbi:MAG: rod shape-determining protein MreC [Endomicrobium sp.]|nr:rod shape-determining protein MreC [Endomicrobium sp.]